MFTIEFENTAYIRNDIILILIFLLEAHKY